MALPEPDAVIAPAEKADADPDDHLRELLLGAYQEGVVLEYHSYRLVCESTRAPRVWDVDAPDGTRVETLNLGAFRSLNDLKGVLNAIVAAESSDREESAGGSGGSR